MKRKKPNVYAVEWKRSTVQLVLEENRSGVDVSREVGISSRLISRWVQEYKRDTVGAFPQKGHLKPESFLR